MKKKTIGDDEYNLHPRLEKLIDEILREIEERGDVFSAKEKLSVVQIVGMYLNRKSGWSAEDESDAGGSAVRRYAGAFKTNVARGGKGRSGPALRALTDDSDADTAA